MLVQIPNFSLSYNNRKKYHSEGMVLYVNDEFHHNNS